MMTDMIMGKGCIKMKNIKQTLKENLFLIGVVIMIIGFAVGIITLKYVFWRLGHPDAPWWIFIVGN